MELADFRLFSQQLLIKLPGVCFRLLAKNELGTCELRTCDTVVFLVILLHFSRLAVSHPVSRKYIVCLGGFPLRGFYSSVAKVDDGLVDRRRGVVVGRNEEARETCSGTRDTAIHQFIPEAEGSKKRRIKMGR